MFIVQTTMNYKTPPPSTAADFQVPNMFFLVIYDYLHRNFSNTAGFSPVPRAAEWVGSYMYRSLYVLNIVKVTCIF